MAARPRQPFFCRQRRPPESRRLIIVDAIRYESVGGLLSPANHPDERIPVDRHRQGFAQRRVVERRFAEIEGQVIERETGGDLQLAGMRLPQALDVRTGHGGGDVQLFGAEHGQLPDGLSNYEELNAVDSDLICLAEQGILAQANMATRMPLVEQERAIADERFRIGISRVRHFGISEMRVSDRHG